VANLNWIYEEEMKQHEDDHIADPSKMVEEEE
jgi:hypothetical protein